MSSPEISRRALEIFESLVDADPATARQGLEELEATRPDIALAVRELLAADREFGLELPMSSGGSKLPDELAGPGPGDRLGPFELVGFLGQGGMGKVWEARRVEGGFEQRVAIKVLRDLEPGSAAERRFLFEREVLGKLEHPAIARILDTGRTPQGAPYLVMEYFDGQRIDDYCRQRGLSVRERVELVVEVCRIVEHAHHRLIIHRDLKPANILVTDAGEPRLLDFGIAKLLSADGDRPTLTLAGLGPMTPEYASPEQIQGDSVTTASDVYSLGVLLYELLTGSTPFESTGLAALLQRGTEAEPDVTPPSLRVDPRRERPGAPVAADASSSRSPEPPITGWRDLDRNLDKVILFALRADPERRYPSVDAFAADLERWLGGYPVRARGDSLAYLAATFVRRNWLALSAAALVFLALAAGFGVATWKAREAREQRIRADDQAARTEQVNRFLVNLLAAPGGRWWRDLESKGPDTRVIDVLDEAAARLETDLEEAPLQRAALHQTLNDTYLALGIADRAEHQVRRALEIRRRELGRVDPAVAESTYYLAATLRFQSRFGEALDRYREAIAIERLLPEPTANLPFALSEAAHAAGRIGSREEMERLGHEALEAARTMRPTIVGYLLANLARQRAEGGDLELAESTREDAEHWMQTAPSGLDPLHTSSRVLMAVVSWLGDDLAAAEIQSRNPPTTVGARIRAQVLYDQGRIEDARRLLAETQQSHFPAPEALLLRARIDLETTKDPAACLDSAARAFETEEQWSVGPTWYLAEARSVMAACLLARGRPEDLERAKQLLGSARAVLELLFAEETPLHRRVEATSAALAFVDEAPRRR